MPFPVVSDSSGANYFGGNYFSSRYFTRRHGGYEYTPSRVFDSTRSVYAETALAASAPITVPTYRSNSDETWDGYYDNALDGMWRYPRRL